MINKCALSLAAVGVAGLLTACNIQTTESERTARAKQATISGAYRPGDQRPPLPALKPDSSYTDFLRYALFNSPAVESAYFDWISTVEKITVSRSLPDPRFTMQMDIQGGVIPSLTPGLTFDIPGPGKLTSAADMTAAGGEAKYYAFVKTCLRTAFDLDKAAREIRFLDRKLIALRDSLKLLGEVEQIARGLNVTNRATLQDVLRAEIEQERLRTEIRNLEEARIPLQEKFKAALGLAPTQPPPPLPLKLPDIPFDETWSKKFLAEALAHNPDLQSMRSDIQYAEASLSMAHKANIPDFSVGTELDTLDAPILVRPMASMTLPIWRDKVAAGIASAQAARHSSTTKLSAEQIALAVTYAEKSYLIKEASRNLDVLRRILLPKSRLALESAMGAYAAGSVDFQTLLDVERMLLNFEIEEAGMVLQYDLAVSELHLLVAGRIPAAASFINPPGK